MTRGRGLEATYERGLWLFDRLRDREGDVSELYQIAIQCRKAYDGDHCLQ